MASRIKALFEDWRRLWGGSYVTDEASFMTGARAVLEEARKRKKQVVHSVSDGIGEWIEEFEAVEISDLEALFKGEDHGKQD